MLADLVSDEIPLAGSRLAAFLLHPVMVEEGKEREDKGGRERHTETETESALVFLFL